MCYKANQYAWDDLPMDLKPAKEDHNTDPELWGVTMELVKQQYQVMNSAV